jgi:hypothetical protein
MWVSESMFFTARRSIAEIPPLRGFARASVADAPKPLASFAIVARATAAEWRRREFAGEKYIFFSADPGGIGSAFHRAEEGRKENNVRSGDTQKL